MKKKAKEYLNTFLQAFLLGAGFWTGVLVIALIEKLF